MAAKLQLRPAPMICEDRAPGPRASGRLTAFGLGPYRERVNAGLPVPAPKANRRVNLPGMAGLLCHPIGTPEKNRLEAGDSHPAESAVE
jgi:hypothetical protein